MTADSILNEVTKWTKRAGSLALLFIVAAMLVEAAAKLFGIGINFRAPGWDQGTAITIAALAYALGRG